MLFPRRSALSLVVDVHASGIVRLVVKPLNRSEARVDFVVIKTLLLFICKSLFYNAN